MTKTCDCQNTQTIKESAQKVVELQRVITKLRAKLKQKEDVEDQNNAMLKEISEYKQKYIESQKK